MKAPKCMDCGKPYKEFGMDSTLPDEQWLLIHDNFDGLLCANCVVARCANLHGAIAVRMCIDFGSPSASAKMVGRER